PILRVAMTAVAAAAVRAIPAVTTPALRRKRRRAGASVTVDAVRDRSEPRELRPLLRLGATSTPATQDRAGGTRRARGPCRPSNGRRDRPQHSPLVHPLRHETGSHVHGCSQDANQPRAYDEPLPMQFRREPY